MKQIDQCILARCRSDWSKVALVILRACEAAGLGNDDENYDLIADRIEELVQAGELEAQGDLENWRGSEVRRLI